MSNSRFVMTIVMRSGKKNIPSMAQVWIFSFKVRIKILNLDQIKNLNVPFLPGCWKQEGHECENIECKASTRISKPKNHAKFCCCKENYCNVNVTIANKNKLLLTELSGFLTLNLINIIYFKSPKNIFSALFSWIWGAF